MAFQMGRRGKAKSEVLIKFTEKNWIRVTPSQHKKLHDAGLLKPVITYEWLGGDRHHSYGYDEDHGTNIRCWLVD